MLISGVTKAGNAARKMLEIPSQDPYTEQVDQIIAGLFQAGTLPSPEEARVHPVEEVFEKHLRAAQRTRAGSSITARLSSGNPEGDGGRLFTRLAERMDDIARDQLYTPIKVRYTHYIKSGYGADISKAMVLQDIGSYEMHLERLTQDNWNTAIKLNQIMWVRSGGRTEDMTRDLAQHLNHHQVPLRQAEYTRLHGIVGSLVDKAQMESEALTAAAGSALQASTSSSGRAMEHLP